MKPPCLLTIKDVCRHVRSKNAGPFWITVDFFFADEDAYQQHRHSTAFGARLLEHLYDVDAAHVKCFCVDALRVIKVSFPRPHPQGWIHERDMHGGQLYVRLLDVIVEPTN